MASRIKKREWLAIVFIFVIFAVILGNYFNGKKIVFQIKQELQYIKYLHDFTHLFPNAKLTIQKGHIHLVFTKQEEGVADEVPVLLYHGIIPDSDGFSVTTENFKNQMLALKSADYTTITMEQFVNFIQGKGTVPKKSILITFDDGRMDSYVGADALFASLHYQATMFIATHDSLTGKNGESKYYLGQDQLEAMINSGRWEIQSHAIQETGGIIPIDAEGHTAQFLSSRMWLADQKRLETQEEYTTRITHELVDAKTQIENTLHESVLSFAYPFGDYGQMTVNDGTQALTAVHDIIAKTYLVAFQQTWHNEGDYSSNFPGDDPIYLKRIEVGSEWTGQDLVDYLARIATKPLPYSDTFAADSGWKDNWGKITFAGNALNIHALSDSTGGFAFLDGSYLWKNYQASATVTAHGSLSAEVYYSGPQDYYSCDVNGAYAQLVQVKAGVSTKLSEQKITPLVPDQHITVGVHDDVFTCILGTTQLSTTTPALQTAHGGIGFKIWKQENGQASLSVQNLMVTSTDPK